MFELCVKKTNHPLVFQGVTCIMLCFYLAMPYENPFLSVSEEK